MRILWIIGSILLFPIWIAKGVAWAIDVLKVGFNVDDCEAAYEVDRYSLLLIHKKMSEARKIKRTNKSRLSVGKVDIECYPITVVERMESFCYEERERYATSFSVGGREVAVVDPDSSEKFPILIDGPWFSRDDVHRMECAAKQFVHDSAVAERERVRVARQREYDAVLEKWESPQK